MAQKKLIKSVALIIFATIMTPFAASESIARAGIERSSERAKIFQMLLLEPTNRTLMVRYAQISIEMRDYEAVVSTLERLVDLEPTNRSARVELALAYFALGSNDMAMFHLNVIKNSGALSPAEAKLLKRYQSKANEREKPTRLSGRVAAGMSMTDNFKRHSKVGELVFSLRHDMGGRKAEDWVTQGFARVFDGDRDRKSIVFRSGPEFRFTGDSYGPRLQPYLQFSSTNDGDEDRIETTFGVNFQNPLSKNWLVFTDFSHGGGEDYDSRLHYSLTRTLLGASWAPNRQTKLRLSFQHSGKQGSSSTTELYSIRLDATHKFMPRNLNVSREWIVGGFLSSSWLNVNNNNNPRSNEQLGYGFWVRSFFDRTLFLEARLAQFDTNSTSSSFDGKNELLTVMLGWEF